MSVQLGVEEDQEVSGIKCRGVFCSCLSNNSERGTVLDGYDVPGCVEDGTWMLWGNSSAAADVLARYLLDNSCKASAFLLAAHEAFHVRSFSFSMKLRQRLQIKSSYEQS